MGPKPWHNFLILTSVVVTAKLLTVTTGVLIKTFCKFPAEVSITLRFDKNSELKFCLLVLLLTTSSELFKTTLRLLDVWLFWTDLFDVVAKTILRGWFCCANSFFCVITIFGAVFWTLTTCFWIFWTFLLINFCFWFWFSWFFGFCCCCVGIFVVLIWILFGFATIFCWIIVAFLTISLKSSDVDSTSFCAVNFLRASFCWRTLSRKRFCSSIFLRYAFVSSSSYSGVLSYNRK